ncbi:MAG: sigma-70 family RNA polymerase sigma factor [Eubacteriales bacterium]
MQNRIGELCEYYASEYLDKVFYFCLKKTGNAHQAEDLASEISLCILEELTKGHLPDHFHGWVWQIARNRYAGWADKKHRQSECQSGWDVSDLPESLQPVFEDPEDRLVAREESELLRRELAFTAREYREILVAYYFEQSPISEIAKVLSLPEGTVKTRLFRGRNRLKEGMNMARTFGRKSITPERISYSGTGSHPSELPNSALNRKIPQNIVLEAHNNPSTPEELSMELGIALPYMEEEIQILCDASLLVKTEDGKVVTDFFIADRDTQSVVENLTEKCGAQLAPLVWELTLEMEKKLEAEGIRPASLSPEDFRWMIAIECVRNLMHLSVGDFQRPDGGNWGLVGYEQGFPSRIPCMGQNGNCFSDIQFWVYGPHMEGFDRPDERMGHKLTYNGIALPLIRDVITGNRTPADFSANEREIWDEYTPRYVHEEDGRVVFDLPVYKREVYKRLWSSDFLSCKSYAEAKAVEDRHFEAVCDYLRSITCPTLHKQLDYVAGMMDRTDGAVLQALVQSGRLTVPKHPSESNATCYLVVG